MEKEAAPDLIQGDSAQLVNEMQNPSFTRVAEKCCHCGFEMSTQY